jgi:hypothetical protein
MTHTVHARVRRHLSKVLSRLSAHKQGGNKEQNRAPSPDTAVEVDRDENASRSIGDVRRPA